MALNDTMIRAAKPKEKAWKLADEKGLYLLVTPAGLDPAREKQAEKIAAKLGAANSFEMVAEEFIEKMGKEGMAETTLSSMMMGG